MISIHTHIPARLLYAAFVVFVVMLALNCGVFNRGRPKPDEVWIESGAFRPIDRSITTGTRVTWVNRDSLAHSVTSGLNSYDGNFDSGDIPPGGTFRYTFHKNGVYHYFSSENPGVMRGTVTVGVSDREIPIDYLE